MANRRSVEWLRRAEERRHAPRAAAGSTRASIRRRIAIARRERERRAGPYGHGWGFAWPADRRILYNRASARPDGRPWSERKKLVWWDEARGEWTGHDTPDFNRAKAPDYARRKARAATPASAGDAPFIMHPDGLGWIWVASGLKDGPLPAHYEPFESPIANPLYSRTAQSRRRIGRSVRTTCTRRRPTIRYPARADDLSVDGASCGGRHDADADAAGRTAAGALLRALARARGRDRRAARRAGSRISTPRGSIDARALVTPRIRPLIDRRTDCPSGRAAVSLRPPRPRHRRRRQRSDPDLAGAERQDHGVEGAAVPRRGTGGRLGRAAD